MPERDIQLALIAKAQRVGVEPVASHADHVVGRPAAAEVAARHLRREAHLKAVVGNSVLAVVAGVCIEKIDQPLLCAV